MKQAYQFQITCFVLIVSCWLGGDLLAQGSKSDEKARAIYADAAAFQNNRAFDLAIAEWERLLKSYPNDPLASSAAHYLGIAQIQLEDPDYDAAIKAFTRALKDKKLKKREEALVNLGWCLFTNARQQEPGSREQKQGLSEAERRLKDFLKENPRGDFTDQAQFYLGEIAYTQGDTRDAIRYYMKVVDNPAYGESTLRPDAVYAAAVAYEEQKDNRQAERLFRTFLKENPKHRLAAEVGVRLGDILLTQNKADEAVKVLTALPTAGSMADYVLLRSGYALSMVGRAEEANTKYEELLKTYPQSKHSRTAAISVGQNLFNQGKYAEAVRRFQTALDGKDVQAADAAHWTALSLMRLNKNEQAMQVLSEALEWAKGANAVTLQMDYADGLYATPGSVAKAKSAYELIARENPDHPLASRAAYNAAFAALQMRKFEDARKWSEWFLQRFPEDPLRNDVAYVAAETLLLQGEHAAAASAYKKLRSADPKNPSRNLWTLRMAMAQYLGSEYSSAISLLRGELQRFANDDRQSAEALFILGASFLYEEQIDAAISNLKRSHQTSDNWNSADEVLLLLAEAYQRNKDTNAAKQTLEALLKKYPGSRLKTQAEFKLGQLSASMRQYDEAIQIYRRVVASNESGGENYKNYAQYGIAWSLMQQEDYRQALAELKPLLNQRTRNSINQEAQLAEGICLRKLGQTDAAIPSLTRFLQSSPEGISLGNALYELGLAYTESKNLPAANEQFMRITKEVPNYPSMDRVFYEMAWNYEENGDKDKAERYFNQLTRDFPKSEFGAEATYMIAQRQYDAKQFEAAGKNYQRVLQADPDNELREKSLYKLGWSYFEQDKFREAAPQFSAQVQQFPKGSLAVEAYFMNAECAFKMNDFATALQGYQQARQRLEEDRRSAASAQVRSLIYLHGAQCYREMKDWVRCQQWLEVVIARFPKSQYMDTASYELAYCKQQQNQLDEALTIYESVARDYRNEVGARARFMMGEIYFGKRDFIKAIPEFQRVMYGFNGDNASEAVKNWQVKSAYEAARCSEILLETLQGPGRDKVIQTAQEFYSFIVEKHAKHELAAQAQTRLGELQRIR